MNTSKMTLRSSLLVLISASLYLVGCGPQNLDDPSYMEEIADAGINYADGDAADRDMAGAPGAKDADDKLLIKGQPNMAMRPGMPSPGAMVGAPVAAVPAIPAEPVAVVKLPPAFTHGPTAVVAQPPVITDTAERIQIERDILHERKVIQQQPFVNRHWIHKNVINNHKFHTTVINQPSYANTVIPTPTVVAETTEVLPTTVIEAPPVRPLFPRPFFRGGCFHRCGGIY